MPRDFDINRIYVPPTAPSTAASNSGDSSRVSVNPPRSPRRRRLLAGIILLLIVALLLALVLHVTGHLAVSSQTTAIQHSRPSGALSGRLDPWPGRLDATARLASRRRIHGK